MFIMIVKLIFKIILTTAAIIVRFLLAFTIWALQMVLKGLQEIEKQMGCKK